MRTVIPLLLAGVAVTPALSADRPRDVATLERATAGRVAGAPVDCIDRRRSGDFTVAGRYLIFRGTPRVTYVNEPTPGCEAGAAALALVFRSTSSRMCRGDIAQVEDLRGGASGGGCSLGRFVPYVRP